MYSTPDLVAAQLGRALTADETAYLTAILLPTADALIDHEAQRSWPTSPVTDEAHYLGHDGYLTLSCTPVTAITSLTGRSSPLTDPETLTQGTHYRLTDPARGRVFISGERGGQWVTVSYTHAQIIPEPIQYAATLAVSGWLGEVAASGAGSELGDVPADVKRYQVGGELTIERFDPGTVSAAAATARALPAPALEIARRYRRLVFV